jgi:hypothetical protein
MGPVSKEKKRKKTHTTIRFLCAEESYWCSPDIDRRKEEEEKNVAFNG